MPPPQVNILPIPKLRVLIVLRATLVHVVHLFLFRQPLSFYDFIDSRRLGRRRRSPSPTVFRTSWVLALARGIDDTKRTYKLLEIYSAMIFGAIQVCGLSRTSVHTNPFLWTLGVGTTIIVVAAVGLSAVIILTVSRWKRSLLLVDTTNQRTPQRNIEEALEQSPETTAWNIWVALSLPIALTIWFVIP
ncbi:hypothetical protein AMATHDRAFT_2803 [Amanita thiersii Skay4041]|uniref:Uncharacterized protein n=1 Tax=Amanita thiersii Skay4041 TaxID=703135 RepID=A0A2A9NVF8_9AGAR|nr:hypothetical protein AMATHDRAFT_2803 [Amanita thiersii Skay4041]